ncbi:MAG: GDSL-type esterase/lipase family protein [Balneolaceae bacterium]
MDVRSRRPAVVAAMAICLGIAGSLLIAEMMVRWLLPQERMATWIEMHPSGFVANQSGGASFQEWDGEQINYRFTDTRLRQHPGRSDAADEEQRILLLGDSFTFGLLLNEEETYAYHLQQAVGSFYPPATILNAGVGGAGLADWPHWLDHFGEAAEPDMVLLFLNTADIDRALSKNLFVLNRETGEMISSQRWRPTRTYRWLGRNRLHLFLQRHSHLANIIERLLWRHLYFTDLTNEFDINQSTVPIPKAEELAVESGYSMALTLALISRMQEWCRANGCRLIVTTTGFFGGEPEPGEQYTHHVMNSLPESLPHAVPFMDNTECVMNAAAGNLDTIRIPGDSHPSAEGARAIADCTLQWLPTLLQNESRQ